MAVNKRPQKPGSNKKPEQSLYQRVSTALNPMTYAKPTAQGQMESWKQTGGRFPALDRAIERATGERTAPSATFTAAKKRSRSR
jgi:hypothetical protein